MIALIRKYAYIIATIMYNLVLGGASFIKENIGQLSWIRCRVQLSF
jgi:hypothetical protein